MPGNDTLVFFLRLAKPWPPSPYLVHAGHKGKIGTCVVLGRQEKTDALSGGYVNHVGFRFLGIHAVDLDDAHLVALEPQVLTGKGTNVDDADVIRLSRLHRDGHVLRVIDEACVRDRLCASRVGLAQKSRNEGLYLVMIPVGKSEDDFLVHLFFVREPGIMNNERPAKAVGILAVIVGVIPIRPGLVHLGRSFCQWYMIRVQSQP